MVSECIVTGCKNRGGDKKYYTFPSIITTQGKQTEQLTRKRRNAWIANLGRLDYKIGVHSKICSNHFISGTKNHEYKRSENIIFSL